MSIVASCLFSELRSGPSKIISFLIYCVGYCPFIPHIYSAIYLKPGLNDRNKKKSWDVKTSLVGCRGRSLETQRDRDPGIYPLQVI